jgi:phosphohistidine phosphatase SixA
MGRINSLRAGLAILAALWLHGAAAQEMGRQAKVQDAAPWSQALAQPHTHLIVRHALAPGTGDPADFDLNQCATQRNLDERGREQARATGAFLSAQGLAWDGVYSSQWCRCMDTARLMGQGEVTPLPALNSLWTEPQSVKTQRTQELKAMLAARPAEDTLLLVTHYANILALTGQTVASGQGLVIRLVGDEVKVVAAFNGP